MDDPIVEQLQEEWDNERRERALNSLIENTEHRLENIETEISTIRQYIEKVHWAPFGMQWKFTMLVLLLG